MELDVGHGAGPVARYWVDTEELFDDAGEAVGVVAETVTQIGVLVR